MEARGERLGQGRAGCEQVAGARGRDRGEDREPERGADLLGGVEQRGGEPGLIGRHAGVRGRGDGHKHRADAQRHDHQAGEQVGEVGAADRDPGQVVQAPRRDQRAGDDHRSRPNPGQQLGGDASGDGDADGERQGGAAGLQRRVAQDVLHVQGEEEEHRQEAGEGDQLGKVGGGEPLDAEDRQRDERVRAALLVDHERGQQREGSGELADRAGRAPALIGCLHQRVDQQQHPAGDHDGADDVEVRERRAASLTRNQPEDRAEQEHGDRGVDEQHPAPARSLGQHAAEKHPGGRGEPGHATPDAERRVPIGTLPEAGRQQRQRGREHHRGAQALREAGADQHAGVPGESAGERRECEQRCPGDEDAAAAEQVAGAAAEEHESAIGEQVAAEHPLQALH